MGDHNAAGPGSAPGTYSSASSPALARAALGMRAQIALALLAVLALAASLALVAIRPLTAANARNTRRRAGVALARAVAGQAALLPADTDLAPLLDDAVGPDALAGAAVLDPSGRARARAGALRAVTGALPAPPYEDRVTLRGETLRVTVALPGRRGAFVGDVSLAQTPGERAVYLAVLLYTAIASAAALLVAYALLTRYTVRPVEALTRAAERVAAGRRDALAEPRGAAEVVRAAAAFNAMTQQLVAREADLSARVEALERTERELRAAQESLVRTERLAVVGRLAAGIAHEVGNPLAAIVGLTDVLKEGGLTEEESRDFADRIGREAQRIHRAVRELLDYARAAPQRSDAGSAAAGDVGAEDEGDVGEAVAQVGRLLAPQKSLRGVAFATDVEQELPRVRLATDRLVQVLLNLALNAADAARAAHGEAGGEVTVRVQRAGRDAGAVVRVEVEDNGAGIPSELRARVFEPFFTTKPAGQGTGLGLAICAVIVEQAGGRVRASARRDGAKGARLEVEIPVAGNAPP